jgi:hypothetical protein
MIFNRLAVAMGGVALISLLKSLQERSRLQLHIAQRGIHAHVGNDMMRLTLMLTPFHGTS